ncbi:MAG: hypothetical protein ACLU0O_03480 [Collinsella sp.]
MAQDMQDAGNVSAELDAMVCDLIGAFLDDLAAGENPGVVVAIEDAASNRYLAALDEDGEEACPRLPPTLSPSTRWALRTRAWVASPVTPSATLVVSKSMAATMTPCL